MPGLGIGLAGGYGAGTVAKTLEDLLNQRIAKQKLEELLRQGEFSRDLDTKKFGLEDRRVKVDEGKFAGEEQERPGVIALREAQRGNLGATTAKTTQDTAQEGEKFRRRQGVLDDPNTPQSLRRAGDLDAPMAAVDPTDPEDARKQEQAIELEKLKQRGNVNIANIHADAGRDRRSVSVTYDDPNTGEKITEFMTPEERNNRGMVRSPAKVPAGMQKAIAESKQSLDSLEELEKSFKPEFVGPLEGRLRKGATYIPGATVDDQYATFIAQTASVRNAVIKAITGAQVGVQEADRIKGEIPSETDNPAVWRAKMAQSKKNREYLLGRMGTPNLGVRPPGGADGDDKWEYKTYPNGVKGKRLKGSSDQWQKDE